jgi:hypothetical protein
MRACAILFACAAAFAQQQTAVRCIVVEAGTGQPLEGVHARLMVDMNSPVYGALTDREGRFSVDPIRAAAYFVTLEKFGYTGRPLRSGGFPADRLTANAGQRLEDCRFEMTRRSGISGRVLDDNGDPVRDIRVGAIVPSGDEVASAHTDSMGRYRLAPGSGRYRIKAHDQYAQEWPGKVEYGPTIYPDIVDARPGAEVVGIDIRLQPRRGGSLGGVVTGALPGERVTVKYIARIDRGESWNEAAAAEDGSFAFTRLRPGSYRLFAEAASGAQTTVIRVALGEANITDLRLALVRPFEVTGTVDTPARSVRIDRVGPGANLARAMRGFRENYEGPVVDGRFVIERVTPGKYVVEVLPAGSDSYVKTPIGPVEIAGPARVAVTVGANGARISGTVGEYPAYAYVYLLPEGAAPDESLRSQRAQDGKFEFRRLAPGTYRLLAADAGTSLSDALWKTAETVEVKEGDRLTKNLKVADAP